MNLDDKQKKALAEVSEDYDAWCAAKDGIEGKVREFRAAERAKLEPMYIRFAIGTHRLVTELNVAKTRIASEVMKTKGTVGVYDAVRIGAQYSSDVRVRKSERIHWDAGVATYTPSPEALEEACQKLGKDPAAEPSSAQFRIEDGKVINVTERFTPESGIHPVVAIVMAEGSKAAKEILDGAPVEE